MTGRPLMLRDSGVEVTLGILALLVSMWLINDAYEGRGKKRPFVARLLP